MNKFGNLIRSKRESNNMLLRHVSAELDIDTAMLSKIERGEKNAKREHVILLSNLFNIDFKQLSSLWLADQIYQLIQNEEQALKAVEIVEEELKQIYRK